MITETDCTNAKPPHQYRAIATKHWIEAQKILSRGPTRFSFESSVETTYEPESDEVMKNKQIVSNETAERST